MNHSNKITEDNVRTVFSLFMRFTEEEGYYHAINVEAGFRLLAERLIKDVPDCADRTAALRALRESLHWTMEALRLEGK